MVTALRATTPVAPMVSTSVIQTCFTCISKCIVFQVEISRSDEVLFEHLTLKEVARIYGRYGKVRP